MLRNIHSKNSKKEELGTVLLELVFLLPFLLFTLFATMEYSRVLKAQQVVSSIAREAAREVFRECSGGVALTCAGALAGDTCVGEVHARMLQMAENTRDFSAAFLPDIRLTLSQYRLQEVSGGPDQVIPDGIAVDGSCGSGPVPSCSKFSLAQFSGGDPELRSLIEKNKVIVVAEVFASYNPIGLPLGIPLGSSNDILGRFRSFYHVALF